MCFTILEWNSWLPPSRIPARRVDTLWLAALGAAFQGLWKGTYPQPLGKTLIAYEGFTPSARHSIQLHDSVY